MKKTVTLFFSLILLFASTHTTLAFHYCGEVLRSVVVAGFEQKSCCGETRSPASSSRPDPVLQKLPCCSNHYLKIATDDYSSASIQQVLSCAGGKTFCPDTGLTQLVFVSDVNPALFLNLYPRACSPPGIGVFSGVRRLAFLCIFRI